MASRPSSVDEAITCVWELPDSVLNPSDKQSIVATLADQTHDVARRYFSAPYPELWVGTLKELLRPTGILPAAFTLTPEIRYAAKLPVHRQTAGMLLSSCACK